MVSWWILANGLLVSESFSRCRLRHCGLQTIFFQYSPDCKHSAGNASEKQSERTSPISLEPRIHKKTSPYVETHLPSAVLCPGPCLGEADAQLCDLSGGVNSPKCPHIAESFEVSKCRLQPLRGRKQLHQELCVFKRLSDSLSSDSSISFLVRMKSISGRAAGHQSCGWLPPLFGLAG